MNVQENILVFLMHHITEEDVQTLLQDMADGKLITKLRLLVAETIVYQTVKFYVLNVTS